MTYLPRYLPLYVLTKVKIPRLLIVWLSYVPIAVLASLIAPGLLFNEGSFYFSVQNYYLLASVPTFFVAIKSKNMMITVLVGLASIFLLNFL